MVVYFSGTGNSRYCAQWLAHGLEDTLVDAFAYMRENAAAELNSEKPWIFVSPTYCWQLPRIFERFLRSAHFTGSQEAWFVMTCGTEIGHPQPGIQDVCRLQGLHYHGVMEVVMPENYVALFPVPGEEEARRIRRRALPVLEAARRCIQAGRDFVPHHASGLDKLKSGPVNRVFYRHIIKAKAFYSTEECIGCGKCADGCVMGNIHLEASKPVWGDKCTHCMACICGCPTSAIEYGRHSRGKPRYQCPEFQVTDEKN